MNTDMKIDCSAAPVITLAGREWHVPKLTLRQSRYVIPALFRLRPALPAIERNLLGMTPETFGDFATVAYWALNRAYPDLTPVEFDDLPISVAELFEAVPTVLAQSGMTA